MADEVKYSACWTCARSAAYECRSNQAEYFTEEAIVDENGECEEDFARNPSFTFVTLLDTKVQAPAFTEQCLE